MIDKGLDVSKIRVLPLLIQPIVENALIHGHEETLEDGIIWIRCRDMNQKVRIEIADNGIGMTEEQLLDIRSRIAVKYKTDRSSFGLYNIEQRLKLSYGEDSRLTIDSKPDEGTTIWFDIPKSF